jgi:para-aminobenzoate synthetase component I
LPPSDFQPLVEELTPTPEPEQVFARLRNHPGCLWLDSALQHPELGRYSFVTADPFDFIRVPADGSDGLAMLAARMANLPSAPMAGLPPFQGGAAGLFGYELGRSLEILPAAAVDEFQAPALAVGLYDVAVAFDHAADRTWIISQGLPEVEPERRTRRAAQRLKEFRAWIRGDDDVGAAVVLPPPHPSARGGSATATPTITRALPPLHPEELAPQHPVPGVAGLTSNFSAAGYLRAVERAIDYVCAGDIFQVNLSQRLLSRARCDAASLYLRLRQCNPAPFAGYFDLGDFQVVSASPERFLRVSAGRVETRPIKGTRPRCDDPAADRRVQAELLGSEKDRAENVMIVDLLRNDLSKVCRPHSVQVRELCRIETYAYVHHLVSVVCGQLRQGRSAIDLLRGAFPGGSVTGAPKIRAMQIIAELEPTARGAYCGSLGYLGFDGSTDLNLLIRTIAAGRGWWQLPVGGGIVAESDPQREYEETWHKAEGLLRALR